jgi:hypothetical protein
MPAIIIPPRLKTIYIEKYLSHTDQPCRCGDADCDERRWAGQQLTAAGVHTDLWLYAEREDTPPCPT